MAQPVSALLHPKYRPDIDGLRAIAVISVVLFHAFPSWARGGFIGVDIFFVISGYLISTLIYENLEKGTFEFLEFYARRIKRIFPALLFVLIASYIFGWFVLLADEYKQLGKHLVAGAGFASNFVLWSESGYFDNAASTKPLLHLWSLGIEEQFYIFWPLILWFGRRQKTKLLVISILLCVLSFALNLYGMKKDVVATFYSPQTRAWELLSGGVLAWFSLYQKNIFERFKIKLRTLGLNLNVKREGYVNFVSFLGCVLLAVGFLKIDESRSFPGVWALVPVCGALLIITAGPKSWISSRVLSNTWLIRIGLISFPLYLWHWPLLSFVRIIGGDFPSRELRLGAVLLSLALAWVTFKCIEQPIRLGKMSRGKVPTLIILMLLVFLVGFHAYRGDGLTFRNVVKINVSANSGSDGGDLNQMNADCGIVNDEIRKLFRMCGQDKRGNVRYALLGDSKADALYPGLVRTSNENGRWLFIGGNSPHGAPAPLLASDPDPKRPLTNFAIDAILANGDVEIVVIVAAIRGIFELSGTDNYKYLENLSSSDRFEAAYLEFNRVITKFISNGKKVVLVVDNPSLPAPKDCINRRTGIPLLNSVLVQNNADCSIDVADFDRHIALYRKLLNALKASNLGSVEIFDPTNLYCDAHTHKCSAVKNGRLMYSYTDHISDYAAGLVGEKLNQFLGNL